jgi:2'-5' RNA ligase
VSSATRTFLALTLPAEAHAAAAALQASLRGRVAPRAVKWVAPANLHMTLRFFGDLEPAALAHVRELVQSLASSWTAVETGWAGLGAFPSPRRAQVLWLGLEDRAGALRALAAEVERRLVGGGFGRADKRFAAHVTLGRVRRGERVAWEALSERLTIPEAPFSIVEMVLFKSTLTPAGPEYTPIEIAGARSG